MQNAQTLLSLIEDNDLALFIKDRNHRYLYINEAGAQMLGQTAAEVVGRSDKDFFESATVRLITERDRAIAASKTVHEFDSLARVRDQWMLFHSVKVALPTSESQILGVSANITAFRDRAKLDVCHEAFQLLKREGPTFAAQLTNLKSRLLLPL